MESYLDIGEKGLDYAESILKKCDCKELSRNLELCEITYVRSYGLNLEKIRLKQELETGKILLMTEYKPTLSTLKEAIENSEIKEFDFAQPMFETNQVHFFHRYSLLFTIAPVVLIVLGVLGWQSYSSPEDQHGYYGAMDTSDELALLENQSHEQKSSISTTDINKLKERVIEVASYNQLKLGQYHCQNIGDVEIQEFDIGTIDSSFDDYYRLVQLPNEIPAINAVVMIECIVPSSATKSRNYVQVITGVDRDFSVWRCEFASGITIYDDTGSRGIGYDKNYDTYNGRKTENNVSKKSKQCGFELK